MHTFLPMKADLNLENSVSDLLEFSLMQNVKHKSATCLCLLTEESLTFMYTKGFIKKEMFNIQ